MPAYLNRFEHPLSQEQVRQLRQGLGAWMASQGFSGDMAGRVVTVIDELFCNTMEHSGAGFSDVEVNNRGSSVAVVFRDDGREFDPFEAGKHDYSLYLASDTDRRLGLYLVNRIASSVSYRREGGVNVVSFSVPADPPDPFKRLRKRA